MGYISDKLAMLFISSGARLTGLMLFFDEQLSVNLGWTYEQLTNQNFLNFYNTHFALAIHAKVMLMSGYYD